MAVISVEVPDAIAKKFNPYVVVQSDELYEELDSGTVVDFWKKWVGKKEFKNYLSKK